MASSSLPDLGYSSHSRASTGEILDQQLQMEWSHRDLSHGGEGALKSRKRKSRDPDGGAVVDADGSAKKRKRKKKQREEAGENAGSRVSEHHHAAVEVLKEAGPPRNVTLPKKITPVFPPPRTLVRTQPGLERPSMEEGQKELDLIPMKQLSSEDTNNSESDGEQDQSAQLAPATDDGTSQPKKTRKRGSMVPILPAGYEPASEGEGKRYHCPVRGCARRYTRRPTLGDHMHTKHAGEILNDNHDGTFTTISREDYEVALAQGDTSNLKEMKLSTSPKNNVIVERKHEKVKPVSKEPKGKEVTKDVTIGTPKTPGSLPKVSNIAKVSKSTQLASVEVPVTVTTRVPAKQISTTSSSGSSSSSDTDSEPEFSKEERLMFPKARVAPDSLALITQKNHKTLSTHSSSSIQNLNSLQTHNNQEEITMIFDIANQNNGPGSTLQPWEIAPGLLRPAGNEPNAAPRAFGPPFTSASGPRAIQLPGAQFEIISALTGLIQYFEVNSAMRVCSVATGTVRVKVGEEEFTIGAGSMWVVHPGEDCRLLNRHYAVANIHVTIVQRPEQT